MKTRRNCRLKMRPTTTYLLVSIAVLSLLQVRTSKVLMLFPMPSYSHYTLGFRLAEGLIESGHEVTMIAPYKQDAAPKNLTEVMLEGLADLIRDMKKSLLGLERMLPIMQIHSCYQLGFVVSEFTLRYEAVLELVATRKEYFDVMVMDQFYDESLLGIAHELDVPLIHFSTLMPGMWVNHLVANPAPASFVPNIFMRTDGHMDLFARMHNWLTNIGEEIYMRLVAFPYHDRLLHAAFPTAPPLDRLLYERDNFVLANSHLSIGDATPTVPNLVHIGGFHVKALTLPSDVRVILDAASEHGVVLFAMGSNLRSSLLPLVVRNHILRAFARLNQTVLWKWEEDNMPDKPVNVVLRKWLPQQAILAHSNTKVFVSHGGMLSTIEAASFGKPVVGIPIYADQVINIHQAVKNGYARAVQFADLTETTLFDAIQVVITNASYMEAAKWRSRLIHDRLVPPLKEAVYWVEYVIRHKGARHMRSKAMDLTWYQYELLDVTAFLLATTAITIIGVVCIIKYLIAPLLRTKVSATPKLPNKKRQ